MGNNLAHSLTPNYFYAKDWHQVGSFNGHPLWQNSSTHKVLQQYRYIAHNPTDLRRLSNLFQFRLHHNHLVSSQYINDTEVAGVQGSHHLVSIFCERIPLRLREIGNVAFPESLAVYQAALKGYSQLYQKVGYFRVAEDMIGVNQTGEVKVWLNGDFSKDRPEKDPSSYTKREPEMVQEIVQAINRHVDHSSEPENFARYFANSHNKTFQGALESLTQYSAKNHTRIPPYIESIRNQLRHGNINISPNRYSHSNSPPSKHHFSSSPERPLPHVQLPLPREAKITDVQSFVPYQGSKQEKVVIPPGVLPQNLISVVPIYAHTPIGLRQISPARIVIRAESPLRSDSPIRSHSPPAKIIQGASRIPIATNSQLHPTQVSQNIPLPNRQSVIRFEPKRQIVSPISQVANVATFVPAAAPFVAPKQAESVITHPLYQQNADLYSLRDRIQSELDRVNSLIKATPVQNQNASTTYSGLPSVHQSINTTATAPVNVQRQTQPVQVNLPTQKSDESNSPIKEYERAYGASISHPPISSSFSDKKESQPLFAERQEGPRVIRLPAEQGPKIIRISHEQAKNIPNYQPYQQTQKVAKSLTDSARQVDSPPSSSHANAPKKIETRAAQPRYDFSGSYESKGNVIKLSSSQDTSDGMRVIYKG